MEKNCLELESWVNFYIISGLSRDLNPKINAEKPQLYETIN